jgi:hypothetical protein
MHARPLSALAAALLAAAAVAGTPATAAAQKLAVERHTL